jgi:hypothetical protein
MSKLYDEMSAHERREILLRVGLPILQGLLSSGQFTERGGDEGEAHVFTYLHGKDWKEDGYRTRLGIPVIEEALMTAERFLLEIEWQVQQEEEARTGDLPQTPP